MVANTGKNCKQEEEDALPDLQNRKKESKIKGLRNVPPPGFRTAGKAGRV